MMRDLTTLLSTPLVDLRTCCLEKRCCGKPVLSPFWFHVARWPEWLLSDLALDISASVAVPALTLVSQDRVGRSIEAMRVGPVDRFDAGYTKLEADDARTKEFFRFALNDYSWKRTFHSEAQ